ncbi:hypothetical protein IX51_00895 [uncultured archaeon]|nr:hypothetical protein IX51_00895 [uncultured archaeon]HKJ96113.1 hypothetical protein [Thermoplasmataceae archaeon]
MPLIKCNRTSIGRVVLDGSRTEIAASIFDDDSASLMRSFESGRRDFSTLYEVRYDLFSSRSGKELQNVLDYLNHYGADYIFTFRSEDPELLSQYYGIAADSGVPAADIEIAVYEAIRNDAGFNTLMLSHHSYSGESVVPAYEAIMKQAPDIVKLASRYDEYSSFQDDFLKLQELKQDSGKCMSYIPMGRPNSFLRIMSAYVLSDLVYAKESGETGEGQLTGEEYAGFFKLF